MPENNDNTELGQQPPSTDSTFKYNELGEQVVPLKPHEKLAPIPSDERLGVMDSIRGFALIGILMMNIEWFNRPIAFLGQFDSDINGIDYASSWFVKVFVEGKFYKLFALLFGMGFAVMLIKAQQAGRPFASMFVRRMGALFAFGMAHYIFLWDGDILHDYAFAGLMLLGWVQLTKTKRLKRFSQPKSFLKFGIGIISFPVIAMIIVGNFIGMSKDNQTRNDKWGERVEIIELTEKKMAEAKLKAKSEKSDEESGTVTAPAKDESDSTIPNSSYNSESGAKNDDSKTAAVDDNSDEMSEEAEGNKEGSEAEEDKDVDEMSREERINYLADKRAKSKLKRIKNGEKESTALTDESYFSGVKYRLEDVGQALLQMIPMGFFMLFPIFLIGYWFIASGVINNARNHSGVFKSLSWVGLLIGLGVTTASLHIIQSPITKDTIYVRNASQTMFQFSQFIVTAGYVGLLVTLYQSKLWKKILDVLAPIGRMALTNYIMHTVILSLTFYGYGAGMFGQISRGPQMLIVVAIIVAQLILSTLWLKHFRFGPLEWIWRCLTYKKLQPMKI